MGPVNALHDTEAHLDRLPPECDEDVFDEYNDDDVISLLEENARLRKLVVRLSELVLRNVADAK